MNTSRIRLLVGAAALCSALSSAPALGGYVYVQVAPPAPIVEVRPPAPSHAHVWIGGYHSWNGSAYVWTPGRWDVPPRPHARWVAGRWHHHHRRGWYWIEGHWRR